MSDSLDRYSEYGEIGSLAADNGSRMRTPGGRGARSWWAGRWLRALTQWVDSSRMAEGRILARSGAVLEMEVQVGLVLAQVQGRRRTPYRVRVVVRTFSDAQWDRIISLMAGRAIYAAQLLNGEMPEDIETVFRSAGVALFPGGMGDLAPECTCADWPKPCKHIAAVYYLLGEWIDADPFLLFKLRGRTQEQVMAALRARRAEQALDGGLNEDEERVLSGKEPSALPSDPERFWQLGSGLQDIQIKVEPPEVERELIKILGDLTFVENPTVLDQLDEVYERVSRRARETAYEDSNGHNGHTDEDE